MIPQKRAAGNAATAKGNGKASKPQRAAAPTHGLPVIYEAVPLHFVGVGWDAIRLKAPHLPDAYFKQNDVVIVREKTAAEVRNDISWYFKLRGGREGIFHLLKFDQQDPICAIPDGMTTTIVIKRRSILYAGFIIGQYREHNGTRLGRVDAVK